MAKLASTASLPFTPGVTSCDDLRYGDGTCDSENNDMTCAFDGGDCCLLRNPDGAGAGSCRSPDSTSLLTDWVVSAGE